MTIIPDLSGRVSKHTVGPVGIEHTVQMVGLMLENHGGKTAHGIAYRFECQCVGI